MTNAEDEAPGPGRGPKLTIKLEARVQPAQYESAICSLLVTDIYEDTTDDELDRLMGVGKIAYDRMVPHLQAAIREARAKQGWA